MDKIKRYCASRLNGWVISLLFGICWSFLIALIFSVNPYNVMGGYLIGMVIVEVIPWLYMWYVIWKMKRDFKRISDYLTTQLEIHEKIASGVPVEFNIGGVASDYKDAVKFRDDTTQQYLSMGYTVKECVFTRRWWKKSVKVEITFTK